ncbi:MAG: hypothetical protein ACPGXY_06190 [Alphaproteobacteria bacterium]
MRQHILAISIVLWGLSPASTLANFTETQMMQKAQDFILHVLLKPDSKKFRALFDDSAQIHLHINHKLQLHRGIDDYMMKLNAAHFLNTKRVELLTLSYSHPAKNVIRIEDVSLQWRNGAGQEEIGLGLYYFDNTSDLTFNDQLQITDVKMTYTKIKVG